MILEPPQARMARAALKLSLSEAAMKLGVGRATLIRLEDSGKGVKNTTAIRVRLAYERLGVRFVQSGPDVGVCPPKEA